MLFHRLVDASARLADEPSRLAKRAIVVALVRELTVDEVPVALGLLGGGPRQGRVGVGWRTLAGLAVTPAETPSLTLAQIDDAFDALAGASGDGAGGARARITAELMVQATTAEGDYLARVFGGEVRHGALDGVLADAVAAAEGVPLAGLRRAAMFLGDLGAAAVVARTGGTAGLAAVGLQVLQPVQPMLASPGGTVAGAVAGGVPVAVEWKLDGARIQAHRRGDEVRLFTRNLNDVTARLVDVAAVVRGFAATSCVLDGEVLGVDDQGRPEAFQDTMSSFSAVRHRAGLRVWFFDLLHLDGRSLVDEPLRERHRLLAALAGDHLVPFVHTADVTVADGFARAALAAGHEGVVVKDLGSSYEAGRRGAAWRKVKPVVTVDLVVLAAEWGHGRRRGTLSNLHLGARDPDGGFVMVGKTFKGLTDALLAWQTERLGELATARPVWGVEVRPELVVEIALDGVQRSRRYPGGVALRFARVRRYREDKRPAEADTVGTLQRLVPRAAPGPDAGG